MLFAMHPLFPMSELALSKTILIDALEGQWPNAVSLCEKSLTGVQLEVVSYSALLAHFLLGTPANCASAPLGHLQVANFLAHPRNRPVAYRIYGTLFGWGTPHDNTGRPQP